MRRSPVSDEERAAQQKKIDDENLQWEQRSRWNDWVKILGRIGKRYATAQLKTFQVEHDSQKVVVAQLDDFLNNIKERTEAGQGLVFIGPRGTGKDHLAVACLRAAVYLNGLSADWIDGQDLYQEFRDNIDSEHGEVSLIKQYTRPDILLISDPVPATATLTDYQHSVLWRIIDRRYRDVRPTWVTLNVTSADEADKRLGAQIVDRLRDGALSIVCNWPSYRKSATAK